jgi:tetratricopeptide (TPR) repeat protein
MRAGILILALVVCAPTVHASPGDAMQDAKDHYDRGMAHYELGEFTAAVEEFKLAYGLSQAPGLLFNLAQASRLGKNYEQSLHFYRAYLRARPDAANRDDVEKRISELEPIVEKRRSADEAKRLAVPAPPPAPLPKHLVIDDRPVVPPPSGRGPKVAGIVVGVAGIGLLGAGIGLGVASLDAQNKLSTLASQMGSWSPEQSKLYNAGKTDAAAATALYVVGGAAVATGVILVAVGVKRDRARFAIAPLPGGGAHAVWSCAF